MQIRTLITFKTLRIWVARVGRILGVGNDGFRRLSITVLIKTTRFLSRTGGISLTIPFEMKRGAHGGRPCKLSRIFL